MLLSFMCVNMISISTGGGNANATRAVQQHGQYRRGPLAGGTGTDLRLALVGVDTVDEPEAMPAQHCAKVTECPQSDDGEGLEARVAVLTTVLAVLAGAESGETG